MSDPRFIVDAKKMKKIEKNTIKAGGSTARARSKMSEWSGVDGWIPLRLL